MSVAVTRTVDPKSVTQVLSEHGGQGKFDEVVGTLKALGWSDAVAKDAIWFLLAQGIIRFSADRNSLQLVEDPGAQKVAG